MKVNVDYQTEGEVNETGTTQNAHRKKDMLKESRHTKAVRRSAQDRKDTFRPSSEIYRHHPLTSSLRMKEDQEILSRIAADAGLNTFGCVFLEVWMLNEDGTKLTRPPGGAWMDSALRWSLLSDELMSEADELQVEALDIAPGVGLAGTLFAETSNGKVHWGRVKSMMNDPFVQNDPSDRMKKLCSMGIGSVGSVSFSFGMNRGIVLFYARSSTNRTKLSSPSNEHYMLQCADFISATLKFCMARQERADRRRLMLVDALRKVKSGVLKKIKVGTLEAIEALEPVCLDRGKRAPEQETSESMHAIFESEIEKRPVFFRKLVMTLKDNVSCFYKIVVTRVKSSVKKYKGSQLHGPPRHSFSDSIMIFVWVFLTMLAVLKLSTAISRGAVFAFDGSWYSGTICIMFALTPAPVGQPRQVVAAHFWSMLVGFIFQQIPTGGVRDFMERRQVSSDSRYGIPLIWKQAMAVGFGVSGQAYLGILHPPATGLSLSFATHKIWSWVRLVLLFIFILFMIPKSSALSPNLSLFLSRRTQWHQSFSQM